MEKCHWLYEGEKPQKCYINSICKCNRKESIRLSLLGTGFGRATLYRVYFLAPFKLLLMTLD